jgi:hypothetical protein
MTMVGGLDVHRQQITFDYVDNDGLATDHLDCPRGGYEPRLSE